MKQEKKKTGVKKKMPKSEKYTGANGKTDSRRAPREGVLSDRSQLICEIENLDVILADKEIFINNLIERLWVLERTIVDMDINAKLSDENVINQKSIIDDRDLYIKALEEHAQDQAKQLKITLDKQEEFLPLKEKLQTEIEQLKITIDKQKEFLPLKEKLQTEIEQLKITIDKQKELLPLKEKLQTEIQANQQLLNLIRQLDRHHEVLFASRTWRVGYFIAQTMRQFKFGRHRKMSKGHITSGHLRNVINGCSAYIERRQIDNEDVNVILHGHNSSSSSYTQADIEVTMKVLWNEIQKESDTIAK